MESLGEPPPNTRLCSSWLWAWHAGRNLKVPGAGLWTPASQPCREGVALRKGVSLGRWSLPSRDLGNLPWKLDVEEARACDGLSRSWDQEQQRAVQTQGRPHVTTQERVGITAASCQNPRRPGDGAEAGVFRENPPPRDSASKEYPSNMKEMETLRQTITGICPQYPGLVST